MRKREHEKTKGRNFLFSRPAPLFARLSHSRLPHSFAPSPLSESLERAIPDTASVHTYPVDPTYESALQSGNFCIRNESGIVRTLNPNTFLSGDVTRLTSVLCCEYCIQDGNLVPRFSEGRARCKFRALYDAASFANIPSGVLGTRTNPDTCGIRMDGQMPFEYGYMWTWRFLKPERKSCGLKNIRIREDGARIILTLFFFWFLLCFKILPPHHRHHLPNCTEVCRSHTLEKSVYNATGEN